MHTATARLLRRVSLPFGRPRRRTSVLLILLACLSVGGLAIGVIIGTRPEPRTATLYACVRNSRVLWVGANAPAGCPRDSDLIRDEEVEIIDPDRSLGHRLTLLLRSQLSIPGVMAVLVVASLFWLRAGWRLSGSLRVRWFLMPLLAFVAAACVAGPGHWFPKEPYEGPSVIPLGTGDAVTVLDLVGLEIGRAHV